MHRVRSNLHFIDKLLKINTFLFGTKIFTARKRSLGQGNIFSSVCQEFCTRGGVCLSAYWDTTPPPHQAKGPGTPLEQTPPGPGTPRAGTAPTLEQTCPQTRHPPPNRYPQSRHPQEQAPPPSRHPPPSCAVHAGRYGQQAGGMHPTGMQCC